MSNAKSHRPARRAFHRVLAGAAVVALAPVMALTTATSAVAADYPAQTIKIVVPFPPGGSTDLLARQIGEKMSAEFGQTVIVENKPGAGGTIGSDSVAKAPGDGYTLLMGVTGTNAISATLYPKLPYDPLKDFKPVSLVVSAPLVLVVNAARPYKSVTDLIAHLKDHPGDFTAGSPGNGTSMHLTGEMFAQATGTQITHVPYKGSAAALQDLAGGQIDGMFGDLLVVKPLIDSGKLRPLAVTSSTRSPKLPDTPTMAESGLKGFEALSWQGMFAPASTPDAIVDKLNAAVVKAVQSDDLKAFFAERGFNVEARSPADSAAFIAKEIPKWGAIVKASGATVQ